MNMRGQQQLTSASCKGALQAPELWLCFTLLQSQGVVAGKVCGWCCLERSHHTALWFYLILSFLEAREQQMVAELPGFFLHSLQVLGLVYCIDKR